MAEDSGKSRPEKSEPSGAGSETGSVWALLRPSEGDRTLRGAARILAAVCGAVYAGSFYALNGPLNALTARFPPALGTAARSALPAMGGAVLCAALWALGTASGEGRDRLLLWANRSLFHAALGTLGCGEILMWGERETQLRIAQFFVAFVLPCLISGELAAVTALALRRYRRSRPKKELSPEPPEEVPVTPPPPRPRSARPERRT